MSIGSIASQNTIAAPQNTATQNVNQAPAALQGAHTSKVKLAARITAGILTGGLSEPIIAIARGVKNAIAKHARVKEARTQERAQARADSNNYYLASHIKFGHKLAAPQTAAMREGLEAVQQDFDNKGLHSTTKLSNAALKNVENAIRASHDEVTPERLKELVAKQVRPEAAKNMFGTLVQAFMTSENLTALPAKNINMLDNPDLRNLKKGLEGCQNAGDVQALYNEFKEPLENTITFQNTVYQVRNEMATEAHAALAERTGLSLETIQTSQTNYALNEAIQPIVDQLATKTTFPNTEQIKTAFSDAIAAQRATQDTMLATIQDLPISPALKQQFSIEICCDTKYADNPEVFAKAVETLKNIDTASIHNAMQLPQGAMHEEEFTHLFKALGSDLQKNFATAYGDGLKQLSKNSVETAKNVVARLLFDQHPEINKAFQEAPKVLNQIQKELISHRQLSTYGMQTMSRSEKLANDFVYNLELAHDDIQATNTTLLDQLDKPKPIHTPLLMQHKDACLTALRDIRAHFGANSIPAGNTVEELNTSPAGRSIVKALANAIKNADEPVTPQETQKLAHDILHGIAQNTTIKSSLHVLAQNAGHNITNSDESNILDLLFARNPDLEAALETAPDAASIHNLLQGLPDMGKAMQFTVDIAATRERVFETVTNSLASKLGITPDELTKDFDVDDAIGGTINDTNQKVKKGAAKPDAEIPNAAQILNAHDGRIQSIVKEKVELLNTLKTLHGAQNQPLSAETQGKLRHNLLAARHVRTPEMLQYFGTVASRLSPDACIAAIQSGDKNAAATTLRDLGTSIVDIAREVIPRNVFTKMGPDEMSSIGSFVQKMLLGSSLNLHNALINNQEFISDVRDDLEKQMRLLERQLGKAGDDDSIAAPLLQEYGKTLQATNILNEILEN